MIRHRAIETITMQFDQAVKSGRTPSEDWLVT